MDDRRILHSFLKDYLKDQIKGQVRSLEEYQLLYPDHEDLIARQWAVYEEEGGLGADAMAAQGMSAWLKEGESLGPYRILRELGRGGQGVVYLAEETSLQRQVALKVLTGMGPGAEGAVRRFQREAQVASRLEHPGICSIHDAGMEDGIPYIAMGYVKGETLARKIREAGSEAAERATCVSISTNTQREEAQSGEDKSPSNPSSVMTRVELNQILELFESAARALHAAHEAGVVHRDIKPGNIMVTPEGKPVILDFGLARDEAGDLPSLTSTGDLCGTPAYMSPEQIAARRVNVDRRTDVYSLGVVLFECLTLQKPFEAPTREGLYRAIMTNEPPDPRRINKNIPRDLLAVLQAALEKDCDRRYQTAEAFAQDLKAMRELRPVQVKPIGPVGRLIRWSRRRPFQAASLFLLIIIISAGSFYIAKLPEYRANREKAARIEAQERQRRAEGFIQDGFQELHEANSRQAITEFEQALELAPKSTESIAGIVVAHLALEDPLAALGVLRRYEELARDHTSLQAAKAEALRAAGRKAEAAIVERALADPELPSDCFVLGYLQTKRGEEGEVEAYPRALDLFTKAVLRSPSPRLLYYVKRAKAASRAGDMKVARECADALIALWKNSSYAWYGRGSALSGAEERTLQIAAYREAIARRPDCHIALYSLGLVLKDSDRLEDAIVAYRTALDIRPDFVKAWISLIIAYAAKGRLDDEVAAGREAVKNKPDSHNAWCNLGLALSAQGEPEGALEAYRKATNIKPDSHFAWYARGGVLQALGKHEDALEAYRKALEIRPDFDRALCNVGRALQAQGKLEDAMDAYHKAVEVKPGSSLARFTLGQALDSQGKHEDALAAFGKALEIKPDYHAARCNLGRALYSQGKFEDALAAFLKAVETEPDCYIAYFDRGRCLWELERHDDAVRAFNKCLDIKPDYHKAWCELGEMLGAQSKFEEALAAFLEAVEFDPDCHKAWFSKGRCLVGLERYEDASRAFEECLHVRERLRIKPDSSQIWWYLGRCLFELERHDDAVRAFKKSLEIKPDFCDAWSDMGGCLIKLGRYEDALRALEECLKINPDDSKYCYNKGVCLLLLERNEDAVRAYRRAVELDPDNADALNNLAWLLVDPEGSSDVWNAAAAIPLANRAVTLTGRKDAFCLDTLAVALFKNEEVAEAVKVQEEVLVLMNGSDLDGYKIAEAKAQLAKYQAALAEKRRSNK